MREAAEAILRGILKGIEERARVTGGITESQVELAIKIYRELSKNAVDEEPVDAEVINLSSEELYATARKRLKP